MTSIREDLSVRLCFICWDVGAWYCDKNHKRRDAILILDESRAVVGRSWRGNLRQLAA